MFYNKSIFFRAFQDRFNYKVYVPPPSKEERRPILEMFVGAHNTITDKEWHSLVEQTKNLSIRGLKAHVQSSKDKVEESIKNAKYWIQHETDDGLKWSPCPKEWRGSVERSFTNFSNTYKPKLRYKDLCLPDKIKSGRKEGKKSWREMMRLPNDKLKVLSGIKSDESYTQSDYDAYMKEHKCFK